MDDSSDDDAAPEQPLEEPSPGGSGGLRMSLRMGGLTSGSQLFKEEDAAIKGGEVTLNFTDEDAGKEFQLNARATPGATPCAQLDTHTSSHPTWWQFAVGLTVEFVKAKIMEEWERLELGADAPVEVRLTVRAHDLLAVSRGTRIQADTRAPLAPQGMELVLDGTAMMDPMSLSDVAGVEAGKTVSIVLKRK